MRIFNEFSSFSRQSRKLEFFLVKKTVFYFCLNHFGSRWIYATIYSKKKHLFTKSLWNDLDSFQDHVESRYFYDVYDLQQAI